MKTRLHTNGMYNNGGILVSEGGGIYNAGKLTVFDSTIEYNRAYQHGGGVATGSMSVMTVQRSTVSSNSARRGAGLAGKGVLSIINSTISGNVAPFPPTLGVAIYGDQVSLNLLNSTIVNNTQYNAVYLITLTTRRLTYSCC